MVFFKVAVKYVFLGSVTNEDIKRYLTAERDAMKTGYSIKTWKMRLFCPEKQMIETTEALYREAVAFYYELLKEREELWDENLQTIQGHLEKLTVPGRDGREPKYIPPGGKLPVYFRRSAMNKAAMAVKPQQAQKGSRKDRCQHHLFQGNVQRPDRHLRSAEALERKEMDLGTLWTYRTSFPDGSGNPVTDTGP